MPVCPPFPPHVLALSTLEGEGTVVFGISKNTNPANTESHRRRPESSPDTCHCENSGHFVLIKSIRNKPNLFQNGSSEQGRDAYLVRCQ